MQATIKSNRKKALVGIVNFSVIGLIIVSLFFFYMFISNTEKVDAPSTSVFGSTINHSLLTKDFYGVKFGCTGFICDLPLNFSFSNPLNTSIMTPENFKQYFNISYTKFTNSTSIQDWEILMLENITVSNPTFNCNNLISNVTTDNGTVSTQYNCIQNGTINTFKYEWKNADLSNRVFEPNTKYYLNFRIYLKPNTGLLSLDLIPKLFTLDLTEYAFLNTSFENRTNATFDFTKNTKQCLGCQFMINITDTAQYLSNYNDIVVTQLDNSGTENQIGCFRGKVNVGKNVELWVNLTNASAGGYQYLWIYHKNNTVVESNTCAVDKVFPFGDEFNTGSLDTAKWTIVQGIEGSTFTANTGFLVMITPTNRLQGKAYVMENTSVLLMANINGTGVSQLGASDQNDFNINYLAVTWQAPTRCNSRATVDTNTNMDQTDSANTNIMNFFEVQRYKDAAISCYQNRTAGNGTGITINHTASNAIPTVTNIQPLLRHGGTPGYTVDWYAVRNFTIPEPTYSWGASEENNTANISEVDARNAIEQGIRTVLGSTTTIFTDKQVYVRNASNFQKLGRFDKVTRYGGQYWAFNYLTSSDVSTNIPNISTSLYVLEMTNLTYAETRTQVQNFITGTKIS